MFTPLTNFFVDVGKIATVAENFAHDPSKTTKQAIGAAAHASLPGWAFAALADLGKQLGG